MSEWPSGEHKTIVEVTIKMKIVINYITLLLVFHFSVFCMSDVDESKVALWISLDYKNCMTNKLPCESEAEIVSYAYISLDTSAAVNEYRVSMYNNLYKEPFFLDYTLGKRCDYDRKRKK
jgi:hypothetical protein